MAVASRVWERLVASVPEELRTANRDAVVYVGTVFELAALLHDVGHCAFSHSIEAVTLNGKPLLGSIRELFQSWHEDALLAEYLKAYPDTAENDARHEQIGLILVRRIFEEPDVAQICREHLSVEGANVGKDIRSLLYDGLQPSTVLDAHLAKLSEMYAAAGQIIPLYAGINREGFGQDLRAILHGLVSGTLDVDRLDYLGRDSLFCGVSYGTCDTRMLIRSLDIGCSGGARRASSGRQSSLHARRHALVQIPDVYASIQS